MDAVSLHHARKSGVRICQQKDTAHGFKGWEFTVWLKGIVKWTLELTRGIFKLGKKISRLHERDGCGKNNCVVVD
jgi:hypothetical protein